MSKAKYQYKRGVNLRHFTILNWLTIGLIGLAVLTIIITLIWQLISQIKKRPARLGNFTPWRLLLFSSGVLLLGIAAGNQEQIAQNYLADTNPKIKISADKPKYRQEPIHQLKPKTQLKARKEQLVGIGEIKIPQVGLDLPIFNSLTDLELARGACVMASGMEMGKHNFALAGHYLTANGALFSPISQMEPGQLIYVSDTKKTYVYQTTSKTIISPTQTDVILPTRKPIISLITCADGGKNRYLVRGKLVKVTNKKSS